MTNPTETKIQVSLRIPWNYHQYLKERAAEERLSMNELMTDCIYKRYPFSGDAGATK